MSAASLSRQVGAAAALACAACGGTSAPRSWLPAPQEAERTAWGGWIELAYTEGKQLRRTSGELIAASADSVWVLDETRHGAIPTAEVNSGKLYAWSPRTGNITAWMLGGIVSTLSNGWFLLLTAPAWAITGGIALGTEGRAAQRNSPPLTWAELGRFARFPQGMPRGLGLDALGAKPTGATARRR